MPRIPTLTVLALLAAAPAAALCPGAGGSDQTSESMSANWALGEAPPGNVPATLFSDDLLITKLNVADGGHEYIEIYNPTGRSIALDNYYLSDFVGEEPVFGTRVGYWDVVRGGAFHVTNATDFVARFPAGASIGPRETRVVFTGSSSPAVPFAFGTPDFEIVDRMGPAVPDMVTLGGAPAGNLAAGLLFNNAEMVMLFQWDGQCDLVCDTDYVYWGFVSTAFTRVDKGGVVVDGPDADPTPSAYLADTSFLAQEIFVSPAVRMSVGAERAGGNGCAVGAVPVAWSPGAA